MRTEKLKIAKCPDCGYAKLAAVMPVDPEDQQDFDNFMLKGCTITFLGVTEKLTFCKCKIK